MRSFGVFLILMTVFWIWLSLARTFYVCHLNSFCYNDLVQNDSVILSKIPRTLYVEADGIKVLDNYPEFFFENKADTARFFEVHKEFLRQLSVMLRSQPNSRLLLIGRHKSQDDIVLANKRLNNMVQKLIFDFSFPENSILHTVQMQQDSSAYGLLGFSLLGFLPASELLHNREDSLLRINFRDSVEKVVYNDILASYKPNSRDINVSNAFKEYCEKLKTILAENPNKMIQVYGYSDTQNTDKEAETLSLHYAESVADYLKKTGIKQKIQVIAGGKKQAVFNELLPDNSVNVLAVSKNRRVEIVLKETFTPKVKNKKR